MAERKSNQNIPPQEYRFTKTDEWIRVEGGIGTVGISYFAQEQMHEIVWVSLPKIGREVYQNQPLGEVESNKANAEVNSPVTGTVVEINEQVIESPELINEDPYGNGWMAKVKISDLSELENLSSSESYDAITLPLLKPKPESR